MFDLLLTRIPRAITFVFLIASLSYSLDVLAQAPNLVNFQAQLDEASAAGPASATFSIYNASEGGAKLWEETYSTLDMKNGYLSVLLGSIVPFPTSLFTNSGSRFLELVINGETLEPRYQLTSVSYALRAQTADQLLTPIVSAINGVSNELSLNAGDNIEIDQDGQEIQISAILPDTLSGNSFSLNGLTDDVLLEAGNNIEVVQSGQTITINSNQPGEEGGINVINAGNGISVSDINGPTTTISVANNSITDAEIKDNSISESSLAPGTAVSSLNGISDNVILTGGTNVDIDQSGQTLTISASGGGNGIQSVTGGTGISVSNPNGPSATISLQNNTINDAQIADNSLSANSLAPSSVGSSELNNQIVLGFDGKLEVQNPSGGIRAALTTSNGGGFLGIDTADNNDAVTIEALGGDAYGLVTVHNLSGDTGVRIWGDQTASGLAGGSMAVFKRDGNNSSTWIRTGGTNASNSWGILGVSDASGNEVITLNGQNGDISITGNLAKGSGSFKIDHPLDPENKFLSHSFVESPDMMNIYNGNVVLDEAGSAWVELPDWFEALNKEFRYQLTCIGGFAQVYIAEEIVDGRFKIAGGSEGLKVSWQVTGVRNDPFAETNRIQVEEEKPMDQRGTYLHPNAYGQR